MATPGRPTRTAAVAKVPDDTALAWELVAAARPHMARAEADDVHIAIGIGETFAAIDVLITAIARDRIAIGEDLLATVGTWLGCYLGQDAEPRLRLLLADVARASTDAMSAPEGRAEPWAAAGAEA
ncbi:hypothetical protein MMAD_33410 [Mycolicibacterium madagascariense]|uniref:Uncharacterized protein n=1 Tax=Mycolicibacterium madagascariense TaxID=212765 RepID=A0A7I7XIL3_9MYCO|nr:hypothetical protein [Mycolicibacterium madagascariense]MCV7011056.1 hypothetical protein [Mycolicibacterium madagascariense]BBZ29046.1 hypothetical protein MMAD_33410 [Mycolicibacterium madagascariense]